MSTYLRSLACFELQYLDQNIWSGEFLTVCINNIVFLFVVLKDLKVEEKHAYIKTKLKWVARVQTHQVAESAMRVFLDIQH